MQDPLRNPKEKYNPFQGFLILRQLLQVLFEVFGFLFEVVDFLREKVRKRIIKEDRRRKDYILTNIKCFRLNIFLFFLNLYFLALCECSI